MSWDMHDIGSGFPPDIEAAFNTITTNGGSIVFINSATTQEQIFPVIKPVVETDLFSWDWFGSDEQEAAVEEPVVAEEDEGPAAGYKMRFLANKMKLDINYNSQ